MTKKNILIIKLSAIGDVLMATPSFQAIRKKYPDARIHLLIGEWSKSVVEKNPNLNEIISVDENIFWQRKLFALFKIFLKLRLRKYNIVYIMHWSKFFGTFTWLLGVPERVGFDRKGEGILLTRKVLFQEGVKGLHMINRYLQLVGDNYINQNHSMDIYLADDEIELARGRLSLLGILPKTAIGIAPGGAENPKMSMPMRRWPVECYADLISMIQSRLKLPVILFGGKSDISLEEEILSRVNKKEQVFNFIGKTTLRESAALMHFCSILITNDSGLLHLAVSVDTPTISIFGPTTPYDKAPISDKHKYLYKGYPCSPCYSYGKFPDCKERKCLADIKPAEVYREIEKLL